MKIGIVGSIWLNTPPKKYGGTEDVIYNLANGLGVHGHDVTVFGPATMRLKSRIVATVRKPLLEMGVDRNNSMYSLYHISEAFDKSSEFDVLHVHLNRPGDYISLPLSLTSKCPVVFSLHFQLPRRDFHPDRRLVLKKYSALPYTTISDSQRKGLALNYVATVYNSLDLRRFPFSERHGNYLVWLGKINPVKGTKEAILAARKAGIKIYIMGAVDKGSAEMLSYYERDVKPLLDDKRAIWLEEVSHNEKTSILSGALAMLNPILWEEPFGLVIAESQATGTPVISYRRGSAPEVIKNRKTGFLVDNMDEMVAKIREIQNLSRHDCRKWVEEMFTIEKMVSGYEDVYTSVIKNWKRYVLEQKKMLAINTTL